MSFFFLFGLGMLTDDRAFTQLTANKQFAQLGLMLLGVLAQVDAAMAVFAEGPVGERALEGEEVVGRGGAGRSDEVMVDVGVAVSREEAGIAVAREEAGVAVSREDVMGNPAARWVKEPTTMKVPRHLKDETREIAGEGRPAAKDQNKDRTKRKKAKVDEFDNIFASLEKSAKRPKKKKKRKEDEFDKLFAGL